MGKQLKRNEMQIVVKRFHNEKHIVHVPKTVQGNRKQLKRNEMHIVFKRHHNEMHISQEGSHVHLPKSV